MQQTTPRENILRKIRQALTTPTAIPFPQQEGNDGSFKPPTDELAILFAEKFTSLQGKFCYCESKEELLQQLQHLVQQQALTNVYVAEQALQQLLAQANIITADSQLASCHASITSCQALIARTGSMVLTSNNQSGRTTSVYAPIHICIAYTNQLVYDIKDGLQLFKHSNYPSFFTLATGPSRTADIEKTLVVGVHGPKEVYCFLVEE